MKFGVEIMAAVLAATLLAACAGKPTPPDPANPPGTVHFLINGGKSAVSAFQSNFEKLRPSNCQSVVAAPAKDDAETSEDMVLVYKCANTGSETFLAFGKAYVETVGDNRRSSQASLEPVYLAEGGTALKMTATTSSCVKYWCALLRNYGPWVQNYQCTRRC